MAPLDYLTIFLHPHSPLHLGVPVSFFSVFLFVHNRISKIEAKFTLLTLKISGKTTDSLGYSLIMQI